MLVIERKTYEITLVMTSGGTPEVSGCRGSTSKTCSMDAMSSVMVSLARYLPVQILLARYYV